MALAMAKTRTMKPGRIGEILLKEVFIEAEDLSRTLEQQAQKGGSLGRIASEVSGVEEAQVFQAIAKGFGLEYLDLETVEVVSETGRLLVEEFCRQRLVVPVAVQGRTLR